MHSRDLELAAEFSKLVGAPNLLVYLGLDERSESNDARAKLKARRKFMQGMQGNPKYKREALFLIRHFASLDEVLGDVTEYLADALQRAESAHLPVIEMTVRGVLAAGGLHAEQEEYLLRNALELGVSERTFRDVLHRVSRELGITDPTPGEPPGLSSAPDGALDLYALLGVTSSATAEEIAAAWERKTAALDGVGDRAEAGVERRRLDIARKVLTHEVAREHYDSASVRTGPPARTRTVRPDQTATAPPVRERPSQVPPEPLVVPIARLEILGDPVQRIRLGRGTTVTSFAIRNGGDGPMGGVVSSSDVWLTVDPTRLQPQIREHDIEVRIERALVPSSAVAGVVTIETDRGERARIVFELDRGTHVWTVVALAAAALLLVGVGMGLLYASM